LAVDSKGPNGGDACTKAYDDEAPKNANDYKAGQTDGNADGEGGKGSKPKANQSEADNQSYDSGYATGKADYDKNNSGKTDPDDSGNLGSGTNIGSSTGTVLLESRN